MLIACFHTAVLGQTLEDLENSAFDAEYSGNFIQAIAIYDTLIQRAKGDEQNALRLPEYYHQRSIVKCELSRYAEALEDLNMSIQLDGTNCISFELRGRVRLKLNDRKGACSDFEESLRMCDNAYVRELIAIHGDKSWNYDKIHKVYKGDSTFVEYSISSYIKECKIHRDTTYSIRYSLLEKADWVIYWDQALTVKAGEVYRTNDSLYKINYYPSGQKKSESRETGWINLWVYDAEWWENGQLKHCANPNDTNYRTATTYHSNGVKSWEANLWNGRAWGLETSWYENGQKSDEYYHTMFDQDRARKGDYYSEELGSKHWDKKGNEIITDVNEEDLNGAVSYLICGLDNYDADMKVFSKKVYSMLENPLPFPCEEGKVCLSFKVNKNGVISDIKVRNGLEESIDKAFVKAIQKIGSWTYSEEYSVYVVVCFDMREFH